jgi:agmatinase
MKPKAVIIPVPYEKTTSYGRGAAYGPGAIIKALGYVEDYDIEENRVLDKASIKILPALRDINTYQKLSQQINKITGNLINGQSLPVFLGGEHTITAAIVSALKRHRSDFTVLHLDAHSDLRDTYGGTKYSHACIMRRIYEMGVPFVSVGVRSQCLAEYDFVTKKGIKIFYTHRLLDNKRWAKDVIRHLGRNFYLTFDVDVMDPSCMPSTGTPEPGGFSWQDILSLLKATAAGKKRMVGMDIVELAPVKGNHAPDFLCAKLVYKILTLFAR